MLCSVRVPGAELVLVNMDVPPFPQPPDVMRTRTKADKMESRRVAGLVIRSPVFRATTTQSNQPVRSFDRPRWLSLQEFNAGEWRNSTNVYSLRRCTSIDCLDSLAWFRGFLLTRP